MIGATLGELVATNPKIWPFPYPRDRRFCAARIDFERISSYRKQMPLSSLICCQMKMSKLIYNRMYLISEYRQHKENKYKVFTCATRVACARNAYNINWPSEAFGLNTDGDWSELHNFSFSSKRAPNMITNDTHNLYRADWITIRTIHNEWLEQNCVITKTCLFIPNHSVI